MTSILRTKLYEDLSMHPYAKAMQAKISTTLEADISQIVNSVSDSEDPMAVIAEKIGKLVVDKMITMLGTDFETYKDHIYQLQMTFSGEAFLKTQVKLLLERGAPYSS